MTQAQGTTLINQMTTLTTQVQTSAKYASQVQGALLLYVLAVSVCLLVLVAARPLWWR